MYLWGAATRRLRGIAMTGSRTRCIVLFALMTVIVGCGAVGPATETALPPPEGTRLPVAPARVATQPVLTATPDAWQSLRRPLTLPTVPMGAVCPKTPSKAVNPDSGLFAAGNGPVYPAGLGVYSGVLYRACAVDTLQGIRLDWFAEPGYSGPVLVRGEQIDGTRDVHFSPANPVSPSVGRGTAELQLTGKGDVPSPSGWRRWNMYLETTAPGCYAFQIDGTSFSTVVVIEVSPT